MTLLNVSGIARHRTEREEDFTLQDISFSQRKLQKIAVAGETGSGKSTLLKIIGGLVQPDTGNVVFEGEIVRGPADTLVPGHPGISYLSQDFSLPKSLRVEQVLEYANKRSYEDASALFKICQIDHLLKRRTDQLSGGEKQRIAIARLLISSPRLLLLDEPFTNLDMVHKNVLKEVIDRLGNELKISCILISHDPEDVLSWADQVLVLKDGKLVQKGSPEKIYRNPISRYVAGLFGRFIFINTNHPLLGKKRTTKKGAGWMFRPEDFEVFRSKKKGIHGLVNAVYFFGSHYEADVECDEVNIRIRINSPSISKGDCVYVALSASDSGFHMKDH